MVLMICLVLAGGSACTNIFKKPLSSEQDVAAALKSTEAAVTAKDWPKARQEWERTSNAWKRVRDRVRLNSDENEITNFERSLARLEAAIQVENEGAALAEIREMNVLWHDLARF